jgi:uncharacterized membrane protein HdeD (DUF308 family)
MQFELLSVTPLVYICLGCAAAMVLLRMFWPNTNRWLYVMAAAFVLAIIGDYFLRIRTGDLGMIFGIGGYLLAHLGFLSYAWHNIKGERRFPWLVLAVILIPLLVYYFVLLWPFLQTAAPLAIAVMVYMLVSCCTLATSIRPGSPFRSWNWVYAAGVLCLVLSDIVLGLDYFADRPFLNDLYMFPLFYTAMVLMAVAVIIQHLTQRRGTQTYAAVLPGQVDQLR